MKKITTLIVFIAIIICSGNAQESAQPAQINFTTFTPQSAKITKELESLTSKEFRSHPEYGVLPATAPCKDCFEVLQKRDEKHRYYVKEGSNGKAFYSQNSYGDINYKDANGLMRSIDYRLKPTTEKDIFSAKDQPFPLTVNLHKKYVSILNAGKELQINRNVTLFIKQANGTMLSLGEPSWSDYTAGDDGVVIHNFYPGIDLEMHLGEGKIESFYRINKPLQLNGESLVIHDNIQLPEGFVYDYSYSEKKENNQYEGALCINNQIGTRYFIIGNPAAYDENSSESDHIIGLRYGTDNIGNYDLYIPINWMNDSRRSYPVVIDPLVSAMSTLPLVSITGSGYSDTCFHNGCSYNLNVAIPPACTITDLRYSFNYRSLGTCMLTQGGWDMTMGTCRSPKVSGTFHTCTINLPGLCILQNLSMYSDIQSCLPAWQCASYNLPFTLNFYRCVQPSGGCSFSCINADTPWDITVTGVQDSLYSATITASGPTNFCKGDSVILTAKTGNSYSWSTGETTEAIKVFSSGDYFVFVTGIDSGCAAVPVIVDSVPPVPTSNSNSPVCSGSDLDLSSSGGHTYLWSGPNGFGSSSQNPIISNTSLSAAGTYSVTITNGCGTTATNTSVVVNTSPHADFDYVQSGQDVTFTDNSQNAQSILWNFGDSSTSNLADPYHRFIAGTFNVCLTANNGCLDSICKTISCKGLTAIITNHGGNTGAVTVNVTGGGFIQGMKLYLRKSGESDIVGDTLIIRNLSLMTTDFDLTGKSLGLWDVVAVYPDGDTATIPQGFYIDHALNVTLWLNMSGDGVLRIGFNQVYTLNYGNNGNQDAVFVPLLISGLPIGTDIQIVQPLLDIRQLAGFDTLISPNDTIYSTINDSLTNTSFRLFYIGKIPAGYTGTLSFIFHVPVGTTLHSHPTISLQLGQPLFESTGGLWTSGVNTTVEGCTEALALNITNDAVDALHLKGWQDCVSGLDTTLLNMIITCKDASKAPPEQGASAVVVGGTDMSEGLSAVLINCAKGAGATIEKSKSDLASEICSLIYGHLAKNNNVAECFDVYEENAQFVMSPIIGNATDPNQKYGPGGGSAGHFIAGNGYMGYVITFENDSNANLPAQKVTVVDTLQPADFDFNSFLFTSVTIGDSTYALDCPAASFIHDFDFRSTMGVKARAVGSFDLPSGIAKWIFYSIDTLSNQITTSALAGFLPPNKISPNGQGYVSFIVKSNQGIQSGDTIVNNATIIFDNNAAINTNTWQSVIDLVKPQSAVYVLTPTQTDTTFIVKWSGSDNFSGVRNYTIYVSDNGASYYPWLTTSDTSAIFKGVIRHAYALYSIATDSAGNIEDAPSSPDATTTILGLDPLKNSAFDADPILFPNPNDGSFTLDIIASSKENVILSVQDVLGQSMVNKELVLIQGKNIINIDQSDLSQGIYFVKITGSSKDLTTLNLLSNNPLGKEKYAE